MKNFYFFQIQQKKNRIIAKFLYLGIKITTVHLKYCEGVLSGQ